VLLLASLIVVFVVGGILGVFTTRARLLGDIDDQLHDTIETSLDLQEELSLDVEAFAEGRESDRAIIIVGRSGDVEFERPPRSESGDLGRPEVMADEIIARDGEVFTVDGIGVDHRFRVAVRQLDDGSLLAIAQPLNELRQALRTLARVLLATLFGVVTVLGLMFWWLARLALGPYDEIIDTADAIVQGDLDSRLRSAQPDPDVQRLVGSFNRMLDQNQEALAARIEAEARVTRFAAEASHELRTPLATIAGYSDLYLSGASTDAESVEKQMTRINGEATRLGRLVESMLTITRLDNEVDLEAEPVDLTEIARAAVADAALGSSDPDVVPTLSLDSVDVRPIVVEGDSDALYRVLANLLANAYVHAPGANVAVSIRVVGSSAVITVSDDGPGMAPEVASQAFDRFYRGSSTSDSGVRTTGLGLSIAAGIVKAHGGTIALATSPGEGATFTIRLPLANR